MSAQSSLSQALLLLLQKKDWFFEANSPFPSPALAHKTHLAMCPQLRTTDSIIIASSAQHTPICSAALTTLSISLPVPSVQNARQPPLCRDRSVNDVVSCMEFVGVYSSIDSSMKIERRLRGARRSSSWPAIMILKVSFLAFCVVLLSPLRGFLPGVAELLYTVSAVEKFTPGAP